jgi:hypothetical protein
MKDQERFARGSHTEGLDTGPAWGMAAIPHTRQTYTPIRRVFYYICPLKLKILKAIGHSELLLNFGTCISSGINLSVRIHEYVVTRLAGHGV